MDIDRLEQLLRALDSPPPEWVSVAIKTPAFADDAPDQPDPDSEGGDAWDPGDEPYPDDALPGESVDDSDGEPGDDTETDGDADVLGH